MATTVAQHPVTAFTSPTNGTSPIDADEVVANDSAIRTAYNAHDADTGIHVQSSVFGSRPAAGTSGRKFITVDQLSAPTQIRSFYDDGTNWYEHNYFGSATTIAAALTVSSGGIAVTGNSSVAGIVTVTGAEGAYNFKVKGEATSTTVRIRSMPTATGAQIQATNNAEDTQVKLSMFALSHDITASAGNITLTPTGGAVVVASGGITVSSGGAAITGNSTITGTTAVAAGSTTNALTVTTTGAIQGSFRYDGSNRLDVSVSSAGAVTFDAVGASAQFTFSDGVTVSGALTASSNLTVTGTFQANGNIGLGNTNADTIEVQGVFISNLVPFVSSGYSLGTSGNTWSAVYADTLYAGASTTSVPSLRIPHGTAPSSPTNGDMWTTTAGLFVRINGVTKTVTLT